MTGNLVQKVSQRVRLVPSFDLETHSFINGDEAVLYSPFTHETILCVATAMTVLKEGTVKPLPVDVVFASLNQADAQLQLANQLLKMKVIELG